LLASDRGRFCDLLVDVRVRAITRPTLDDLRNPAGIVLVTGTALNANVRSDVHLLQELTAMPVGSAAGFPLGLH